MDGRRETEGGSETSVPRLPSPVLLVVLIFGLMATGKTTLARALGQALSLPVIETDRVRKTLAGLAPTTRAAEAFGQGIYAADFSSRTYAEMRRQAAVHLAAGESVILDGSYKRAGNGNGCGNWPASAGPQCFSSTASAPRRRPAGG